MQLIIKNFQLLRNNVVLFKNLNLNLKNGDIIYVTGANGIGKSTFLRSIAGYYSQYKGSIKFIFNNQNLPIALHCSYLSIASNMLDMLNMPENLQLWQNLTKTSFNVPKQFSAIPDYLFKNLSSGQQKQSSIAQFLAMQRPLWLLDEPCVHLDRKAQRLLFELLQAHSKNGGIAIITSHNNHNQKTINLNNFI